LAETTYPIRIDPEELLNASVRQLEALTALAAAPAEGLELEQLFEGLADTITRLNDYRTCIVLLVEDEAPFNPRVISYSANVASEYVARLSHGSYPREQVYELIKRGERIELGKLGFASYYPPNRYHLLDEIFPDRFNTEVGPLVPEDESHTWSEGDALLVPLETREGEFLGMISLDDPRSGRAPDRGSVLPAVALRARLLSS
jgi:hypothetical protein